MKEKNKSIISKTNKINLELQKIEELKRRVLSESDKVKNTCNHDIIFVYDKTKSIYDSNMFIRYCKCLICNRSFTLDAELKDYESNEYIEKNKLIDVLDEVSLKNVEYRFIMIEKVEKLFHELSITNKSEEEIKDIIKMNILDMNKDKIKGGM